MLDCPRSDLHLSLGTPALRRESSFEPAGHPDWLDGKYHPKLTIKQRHAQHPQLRIPQQLRVFVAKLQIFQFLLVY
jgi:hypothetical protein